MGPPQASWVGSFLSGKPLQNIRTATQTLCQQKNFHDTSYSPKTSVRIVKVGVSVQGWIYGGYALKSFTQADFLNAIKQTQNYPANSIWKQENNAIDFKDYFPVVDRSPDSVNQRTNTNQ